jgi:hypothetical protein
MIDGGEADWKLLAVRTDDPLAAQLDGACVCVRAAAGCRGAFAASAAGSEPTR